MSGSVWDRFLETLAGNGKLDEFCSLDESDIERWLTENGFDVSVAELVAAAPKEKLDDGDLDAVSGGRVTIHSVQDIQAELQANPAYRLPEGYYGERA